MVHRSAHTQNTYTEQYPCPYFEDGREATVEYIVTDALSRIEYHRFLSKGYRRLGRIFYRNVCLPCTECRPLRIEVDRFSPGKSSRRTLRENKDLQIQISSSPAVTPEKYALYQQYVRLKHGEPDEDPDSGLSAVYSMHYGYEQTIEMNYFHGGTLIGVGIVDEGEDCLSSNYFYYDTTYLHRRPGIFSILQEILLAGRMGKKYYYLGFYIADNSAMSYKKDFRPNQVLEQDTWAAFSE